MLNVGELKRYRHQKDGKAVVNVCQAIEDMKIEEREEGEKIGVKIGEKRMADLISSLMRDGRIDDISRVSTDKDYRQEMYREYNL